ncbi:hypothetical protein HJC23_002120 [Cyclotella cryptica]|uniref:Uncharacterized protein n=1 Tax=Cyclotella cryptica TaxID=29204 RepID=A0ABD3Q0J3_9STRA
MKSLFVVPIVLLASCGASFVPSSRCRVSRHSLLQSQNDRCELDDMEYQSDFNAENTWPSLRHVEATRRSALQLLSSLPAVLASASSASAGVANALDKTLLEVPTQTRETTWPLGKVAFSLLPLAGSYSRRATVSRLICLAKLVFLHINNTSSCDLAIRSIADLRNNHAVNKIIISIVKETIIDDGINGIWTFDQIQGVVNVNVPVRMTVIKLSSSSGGGLWIHNPLAPTPELIQQIRSLEQQHGPVRHIVLGTVALEHKATLGPFAQYFSRATVWIQPGQWSFPVQLPVEFLGVTQNNDQLRILPSSQYIHGQLSLEDEVASIHEPRYKYWAKKCPQPEWIVDIDYESLGPLLFRSVGAYSETAFFHKSTKTLIVTDCVCSVTKTPPKVIQEDPRALLYHARDSIDEVVVDDQATREKGWRRMVQFGLVFFPSQIEVVPLKQALSDANHIEPSMKSLGVGGVPGSLYPWTWHDNDADLANFNAISQSGKLFCPPILTKLILDREPEKTLEWVNRITQRFEFTHVIPAHLNNFVKAGPKEFSQAFDPLRSNPKNGNVFPQRALAEDLALLQEASDLLTKYGVVAESKVCDLEQARRVGRFAAFAPK